MARLIIITSSQQRHKYFVNTLAQDHEIVSIFSEQAPRLGGEAVQNETISAHFNERTEKECSYFGKLGKTFNVDPERIRVMPYSEVNNLENFRVIEQANFDFIVLYGSSIIKDPLLSYVRDRIINMHLGLSPYYRGSGTNFWPLVNCEPECVGVTIHHTTLKVDAGDILAQVRPAISIEDRCHDYGCKAIMAGTELMSKVLMLQAVTPLPRCSQVSAGKLYRISDFNANALQQMHVNFASGMNERYLSEKFERDEHFPIVSMA